jgi:TPR repeat protein
MHCPNTVLPVHIGMCAKCSHDKLALLLAMIDMTEETTDENTSDNVKLDDIHVDFSSGIAAFEAKSFKQSLQFLGPLAENGDAESQHRCAIMYQNGLGFMYMEGECVEKNSQEAVKWFTKAGEQGLVGSLTTLAMMYQEGNGIEQNLEEAKRLYKLAGFDDMI